MANIIDHLKAAVTGDDPERLAGRRPHKETIAAEAAARQADRSINQQIQELNARKEKEASDYEQRMAKPQSRLAEILADMESKLLAVEPLPQKLVAEQTKLEGDIAAAGAELETTLKNIDGIIRKLRVRKQAFAVTISEGAKARSALSCAGLANPELLIKRHIADQCHVWATARVDAANSAYQSLLVSLGVQQRERESHAVRNSRNEIVRELQPSANEQSLLREVDYWLAEINAAESAQAEAAAEKQRIRDAIVSE